MVFGTCSAFSENDQINHLHRGSTAKGVFLFLRVVGNFPKGKLEIWVETDGKLFPHLQGGGAVTAKHWECLSALSLCFLWWLNKHMCYFADSEPNSNSMY